jgi:hypothetical protein
MVQKEKKIMKKQKMQLLIVFGLLIIIICGYFGLKTYNDKKEKESSSKEETYTVSDFNVSDVVKLNVVYGESNLTFIQEDGTWYDEEDRTLDIDESTISSMLTGINNIKSENCLTNPVLSDYGLDTPTQVITVSTASDDYVFYFGSENDIISEYYFYLNNSDKIYTLDSSNVTAFQISLDDYIVKTTDTSTDTTTEE